MAPKFKAPEGVSAKGPLEEAEADLLRTAYAELDQQASEDKETLSDLQKQVEDGLLVEPKKAIESAMKAGEVFEKARFVGLQQKNEELTTELKTVTEKVGALEISSKALEVEKTSLTESITGLTAKVTEAEAKVSKSQIQSDRLNLIVTKYPQLAPFEKDGLLPQAETLEALEASFDKFAETIGTIRENSKREFGQGGGGGGAGGKDDLDPSKGKKSAILLAEAKQLISQGKITEYNEKYDAYQAALVEETGGVDENI